MPTPLPVVNVHGKYLEPNSAGTPRQGTVTFTPSPAPIAFPDQNIIVLGTETATLDSNGEFTIALIATDTANQNPTGWTYTVTEKIIGERPRTYQILLPYTVATIELSDITPTDAAPTYLPVVGPQGPPGIVQSVNGYSAISITLSSADVGAVPLTQRGAANGVATLDGTTHVPAAQLPDLSGTYIATTQKGAASGVASLDSSSHLTASQYDWSATTPVAIANAGAVGTSTQPARSDHTHAGVALTGNQTVAGIKTFSSSPSVPTPSTSGDAANKGYTDGAQTYTGAKSWALATAGDLMLGVQLTGDTNRRFQILGDGTMSWGPGNAAVDATLFREATGVLTLNSTGLRVYRATTGDFSFSTKVTGDTNARFYVQSDGTMNWGPATTAADTVLFRGGINQLTTNGQLLINNTTDVTLTSTGHALQMGATSGINLRLDNNEIQCVNNGAANVIDVQAEGGNFRLFNNAAASLIVRGAEVITNDAAATSTFAIKVTGDTVNRLDINSDGLMSWGPGNAVSDGGFGRISANVLGTVDAALRANRSSAGGSAISTRATGDTANHWQMTAAGLMEWGPGNASVDTNLYRLGLDSLKTDDSFTIGANFLGATNQNTGAWTAHTPTWTATTTNPTLGNGTLVSRYCRVGRMITWIGYLTCGSTTNGGTGVWSMSLPTAAAANSITTVGSANFVHLGDNEYVGVCEIPSGASTAGFVVKGTASISQFSNVSNSFPSGTDSNVRLMWSITYEAAS
jgi:hypothetical protein